MPPFAVVLCYGGLCLHQPLKRGWDTHRGDASYHVMAGYVYINPLAGLIPHSPVTHPTMLWQVMLTSTFVPARAEQSGALALPSAAEGRAKHHPLAGLILPRLRHISSYSWRMGLGGMIYNIKKESWGCVTLRTLVERRRLPTLPHGIAVPSA